MRYEFSVPTSASDVPTGPDWLHEVKYDGYRMMCIRDQDRVRLLSTSGRGLASRFPLIVDAALRLRQSHFILDGEAVVLDADGISDFAALYRHSEQARLYAFDMLAGDGEDHRKLTLALRKANLARLPANWLDEIRGQTNDSTRPRKRPTQRRRRS
jgi:bifunctional non-homologous end joining protein LigD